jgi:glycerol dehydrogenase
MAEIRTPRLYLNEPGAISKAGSFVGTLGSKALIIGGATAFGVAREQLTKTLAATGVQYHFEVFEGFPTTEAAERYAGVVKATGADVIIGVGGGRALDTAKLSAHHAGLDLIAIPTIAATCAAFAAVVVLYNKDGASTGYELPDKSPVAVFVDPEIIAQAPLRYLNAGLADTLAKWYENLPIFEKSQTVYQRRQFNDARLALETIQQKAPNTLTKLRTASREDARRIGQTQDFIDLVDAIILLAGLVGGITSNVSYAGFAHPFYTGVTFVPESRTYLHGERVSFGLLAQAIAHKKDETHLAELLALLELLEQPLTLAQIGIEDNVRERVGVIARETYPYLLSFTIDGVKPSEDEIAQILLKTDRYGREHIMRLREARP